MRHYKYNAISVVAIALIIMAFTINSIMTPTQTCMFCLIIRYLLLSILGIYISTFLRIQSSLLFDLVKWAITIIGLTVSLRQLQHERTLSHPTVCLPKKASFLKSIIKWLQAGTPACYTTPRLGSLTACYLALHTVVSTVLFNKPLYLF